MDKTIKLRLRGFIALISKSKEPISEVVQAPVRQPCEEKFFNIDMSESEKQQCREFSNFISRFEEPVSKAVRSLAEMLFNIVTSVPDFANFLQHQRVALVTELLSNKSFQKLGCDGCMIPGHHCQVTVCGTTIRNKTTWEDFLYFELALVSIEEMGKFASQANFPYYTCWIRCKVAWMGPDNEVQEQIRSVPYPGLKLLLQPKYHKIDFQKRQSYPCEVDFESCDYEEYKCYPDCLDASIEINPHEAILNMDMSESEKHQWEEFLTFTSTFEKPVSEAILTLAEMLFKIFPSIPDFEAFVQLQKVPLVTELLDNHLLQHFGCDIHFDDIHSQMTIWRANVRNKSTHMHPLCVGLELQNTADTPICTCWIRCKVVSIGPHNQKHTHIKDIPYPGFKLLLQPTYYDKTWPSTQCYSFTPQFRRSLALEGRCYPKK